jgi:hypothetical protein
MTTPSRCVKSPLFLPAAQNRRNSQACLIFLGALRRRPRILLLHGLLKNGMRRLRGLDKPDFLLTWRRSFGVSHWIADRIGGCERTTRRHCEEALPKVRANALRQAAMKWAA